MPLSERARIEVYLPDLPRTNYQEILAALKREFTYTFGGCTIIRSIDGSYLSHDGDPVDDQINLIYTDTPYSLENNFEIISVYAAKLKAAMHTALDEEGILLALIRVHHAD